MVQACISVVSACMLLWLSFALDSAAAAERETILLSRADGAVLRAMAYGASVGCPNTALFSHGLGAGIEAASELAKGLSAQGWRVLVMEHVESGPGALVGLAAAPSPGEYFRSRAGDPHRHKARFDDLDAAFAEATRLCRPSQLLLIGHSMGATTAMLEAGAEAHFGRMGQDRFDAYVALSPRGAGILFPTHAWRGIVKPMLMVTGPDDASVEGDWRTRLSAFEGLPSGGKRLAIVPQTSHFEMGGQVQPAASVILSLVLDFAETAAGRQPVRRGAMVGIEIREK